MFGRLTKCKIKYLIGFLRIEEIYLFALRVHKLYNLLVKIKSFWGGKSFR